MSHASLPPSVHSQPDEAPIMMLDLRALDHALGADMRAAVARVADAAQFVLGPTVTRFEQRLATWLGIDHVVSVASGSDALVIALWAAGVRPGDAVITTPLSFVATVGAILRIGALPRFVDVDDSLCVSASALRLYLSTCRRQGEGYVDETGATLRAILPVHLYGRVGDMASLSTLAAEAHLALIHDAAHALGARVNGVSIGVTGGAACLSFHPTKNLGAWGDGGALLTGDPAIAAHARALRTHGRVAPERYAMLGLNSRLDAIQAAILLAKLPHLRSHESVRRKHATRYSECFRERRLGWLIDAPPALTTDDACHLYTVRVRKGHRDALRHHLSVAGIETRVYYPVLLSDQPLVQKGAPAPYPDFPNARRATEEVLSLPAHPFLAPTSVERVVQTIDAFVPPS